MSAESEHIPSQLHGQVSSVPMTRNSLRVTIACCLAQLSIGYGAACDTVVPARIQLPHGFETALVEPWNSKYYTALTLFGISAFGAISGAGLLLVLGRYIGRKADVCIGVILACIGGIVQASSYRPLQVCLPRL